MLAVLTGPVRSGKSSRALALAIGTGKPVIIAAGGRPSDPEMERRIASHREARSADITVAEAGPDPSWLARVPQGACLLVDCLGTLLGTLFEPLIGDGSACFTHEEEDAVGAAAAAIVEAIAARDGDTVIVTNEVGWGVVPATPSGRLFRDIVGRANRTLIDRADCAWLVVDGRCIDLAGAPREVAWPGQ